MVLSTSGASQNLVTAVDAAADAGIVTIGLLGRGARPLHERCTHVLAVPTDDSQAIQECHLVLVHALVEQVEGVLARAATEVGHDRLRLDGRTVLVTGGSGFLGRQWAAALLDAGATVVSADVARPGRSGDARVRHEPVDIADADAVQALAARLADAGIEVDVLVNNAAVDAPRHRGRAGGHRAVREASPSTAGTPSSRSGSPARSCAARRSAPPMAARGRGTIVNIASDLALVGPDQRLYRVEGVPDDEQPVKPVTYSVIKTGLARAHALPRDLLGRAGRARATRCASAASPATRTRRSSQRISRTDPAGPDGERRASTARRWCSCAPTLRRT